MKYYKLTNKSDRTRDTQWGENVTHTAQGTGNELCSFDVIHVYDHPLRAVMFNPIHAGLEEYNLWEVKVKKVVANDGLKVGVKTCTTIRKIEPPVITLNQRIRFAILVALEVYQGEAFVEWAKKWLSGEDRGHSTAYAAAHAAYAAAHAAANAAHAAAADAADAAAHAAFAAKSANRIKKINFVPIIKKAIKEEICQ